LTGLTGDVRAGTWRGALVVDSCGVAGSCGARGRREIGRGDPVNFVPGGVGDIQISIRSDDDIFRDAGDIAYSGHGSRIPINRQNLLAGASRDEDGGGADSQSLGGQRTHECEQYPTKLAHNVSPSKGIRGKSLGHRESSINATSLIDQTQRNVNLVEAEKLCQKGVAAAKLLLPTDGKKRSV
jgi:hypothetical protein